MVTVNRRSEFAAALCYAALTPPAACRSLWIKRAAGTRPKEKKKKKPNYSFDRVLRRRFKACSWTLYSLCRTWQLPRRQICGNLNIVLLVCLISQSKQTWRFILTEVEMLKTLNLWVVNICSACFRPRSSRFHQYRTISPIRALSLKNIRLGSIMAVNGCTACLLC